MSNENNEYTLNYEKLYLGKEDMIKVIDNAYNNIKQSDLGSKKLAIGIIAVKFLVSKVDEATLNMIWNEIIKFTDDLRTKNAFKSDKRFKLFKDIDNYKEKQLRGNEV